MPRVQPIDDPTEEQQRLLAKSLHGPDGEPLNVFKTLVRQPELMRRVNALGGYFFVAGTLSVRERELVILRTARRVDCDYEIGQHRWIAADHGLDGDAIEAALDPASGYAWDERDRWMLAFVDELLATDRISNDTWQALGHHYDNLARMELLVLVGYYRMLAGVLNGLEVQLDAAVAREPRA